MIELTFLKELMLIKQAHQKSVMFVTIGISWIIVLSFNQTVYNRCPDLLMMSVNLSDLWCCYFKHFKGSDYHCINSLINKNEAINLLENADLTVRKSDAEFQYNL